MTNNKAGFLVKRGFAKFYDKYTDIHQKYSEEVDLIFGMRYGQKGVQPCHTKCGVVCVSSSGDCLCEGCLLCKPIEIEGGTFYIIHCMHGVRCGMS